MVHKKMPVIVEVDENGYYVYCPSLKGCHSQGDTLEEALENIKEAIELYLESLEEEELDACVSRDVMVKEVEVEVARKVA
jgi:predicted RNase H-like HicB family nuclease